MAKNWLESPKIRHYRELLGVESTSSPEELKRAYLGRAKLYHPDRNPEGAEQFRQIQKAYEILSNPYQVRLHNKQFAKSRLMSQCVEGLNVCFGSLFGYRVFSGDQWQALVPRSLRLGDEQPGQLDRRDQDSLFSPLHENNSILDDPAYDAIELVYAGRHTAEDEELMQDHFGEKVSLHLPWVLLNNQGIMHFLEGDYKKAFRCYKELNERIPGNIVFNYRLGLCHLILAFKHPRRTFTGRKRCDPIELAHGFRWLRQAIHIGASRSVGKQKCLLIRKTLAEAYEKSGQRRKARKLWKEIHRWDPQSIEALYYLKGKKAAAKAYQHLLSQRSQKEEEALLLPGI